MLASGALKSCCAGAANAISRPAQRMSDLAKRNAKFHHTGKPRLPTTGLDNEQVIENTLKPSKNRKNT
jgi:hypothetical protein